MLSLLIISFMKIYFDTFGKRFPPPPKKKQGLTMSGWEHNAENILKACPVFTIYFPVLCLSVTLKKKKNLLFVLLLKM